MPTPERLELLYDLNRRLTRFTDPTSLVAYATRRARESSCRPPASISTRCAWLFNGLLIDP